MMIADLLLAYACVGLAAAILLSVRLGRRIADPRSSERQEVARKIDGYRFRYPDWLLALLLAIACMLAFSYATVFWPAFVVTAIRKGK